MSAPFDWIGWGTGARRDDGYDFVASNGRVAPIALEDIVTAAARLRETIGPPTPVSDRLIASVLAGREQTFTLKELADLMSEREAKGRHEGELNGRDRAIFERDIADVERALPGLDRFTIAAAETADAYAEGAQNCMDLWLPAATDLVSPTDAIRSQRMAAEWHTKMAARRDAGADCRRWLARAKEVLG